jgi:RHS repeat-associated protein
VTPLPGAPSSTTGASICSGNTATISAVAGSGGSTIRWYSASTGGTALVTALSYTTPAITTATTYYACTFNTTTGCDSSPRTAVTVSILTPPAAPVVPIATSNTCGAKTLSYNGTPAGGISWYWQGTNSLGTDYNSPTATAPTYSATVNGLTTYYIRSRNSSGCWSTASTAVNITVDIPTPPQSQPTPVTPFCEWDAMSITAIPSVGTAKWYSTSDHSTSLPYLGNTYVPTNLDIGVYTYNVTNVDASGCESTAVPYALVINSNCDNFINWRERIAYTYNTTTDPTSIVAADTKVYSDGFGKPVQSQSKSIANNLVFASESISDKLGSQTLTTLPAPINSSSFAYRYRFTTNNNTTAKQKYSWSDFDIPPNNGSPGEANNPNPIGNNGLGTLGWYYSSANTLEPNTPTTSYPYARTYTPPGPYPTTSKSSVPGDAYKMGNNHESQADKIKISSTELTHYFSLRPYFNSSNYNSTLLININNSAQSASSFQAYNSAGTGTISVQNNTNTGSLWLTYLLVAINPNSSNPGLYPINGTISVTPGSTCVLQANCNINSNATAKLHVTDGAGNDILWGAVVPALNSSGLISSTFTVPSGVTSIKVGIQWSSSLWAGTIYVSSVQLLEISTPSVPVGIIGYKIISTDADKKQVATFIDADGHTLATALVTSLPGVTPVTYDNNTWSYNFYNDLGQLVASIAPNGVIIGNTTMPQFVTTYKYDQLGRLIETTSPDEGTSQLVYSADGKIRFSQNQDQRTADPNHKRFSYTNYDYLGRLIESGEYTYASAGDFVFDPAYNAPSSNSVLNLVDNVGYTGATRRGHNSTAAHYSDTTFIDYDIQLSDFVSDGTHTAQNNLIGQISRTKNGNATTWYSYDEFGNVEWTMQYIVGPGYKTVDYTFDFLGNVTQVAYQKGQVGQPNTREPFFHHNSYDKDSKLIDVSSTLDGNVSGQTFKDHARYKYYLHGPLKRMELGIVNPSSTPYTITQGVDYVYTINGSLKSINHADQGNDPGHDLLPSADAFGETLNYFSNDYAGAGYNAGTFTYSGATISDYYSGQIKSASWFSPVDNLPLTPAVNKKVYGYSYDNLNRFSNAQLGTVSANPTGSLNYQATISPTNYREGIGSYDKNGNIQSLVRDDKNGNSIANYNYVYSNNSNQLTRVKNNGVALTKYTYNAIGQMIRQSEGGSTNLVVYNAYGLIKEMRDSVTNNLITSYAYDDRGDRVKQTIYSNGVPAKTTYYVRDATGNPLAVYEQNGNNTLAIAEQAIYGAGRIGMMKWKNGQPSYFYEVNDHLGNVRAVVGTLSTDNFLATMEPSNAPVETKQFVNLSQTAVPYGSANNTPGGSYVSRLNALQNGSTPPHIMGPGIVLAVAPGDAISASVYGYYESGTGNGTSNLTASAMAAALVNAMTGVIPGDPNALQNSITNSYNPGGVFAGELNNTNDNVPHAYLNMIMLDGYMNPIQSTAVPFTNPTPGTKLPLSFSGINITSPGYVFIWVDVSGSSNNYVYFDDLFVQHTHSPIVAGGDFYPFGLTMDDRQIKSERYRYGYQGQVAEKDSVTNLNQFKLRMYDPRFGRWLKTDTYAQFNSPYTGMGNIPTEVGDVNGGYIYILNSGGTKQLARIIKSFNIYYSTPKGKAMIDKYINDPNNHIRWRVLEKTIKSQRTVDDKGDDIDFAGGDTGTGTVTAYQGQDKTYEMHEGDNIAETRVNGYNIHPGSRIFAEVIGHEIEGHADFEFYFGRSYLNKAAQHSFFGSDKILGYNWTSARANSSARLLAQQISGLGNSQISTTLSAITLAVVGKTMVSQLIIPQPIQYTSGDIFERW